MMSAAVDLVVFVIVEVDEVDQEFSAIRAGEAGGVPTFIWTCSVSKNTHVPRLEGHLTTLTYLKKMEKAIEFNF